MDPAQGGVSAAAPLSTNIPEPSTIPAADSQPGSDLSRAKSLKRARQDQSQNSSNLTSIASAGLGVAPSPKSPRFKGAFSAAFAPITLTGAQALEDERRKLQEKERSQPPAMSENPGHKALSSLMAGGGTGMSKPQDAPVDVTSMSEGLSTAANAISVPTSLHFEERPEASPASVTSLASLGSTAQTATANSTLVASPADMTSGIDTQSRSTRGGITSQTQAPAMDEQSGNHALSYPGNTLGHLDSSRAPARVLSLPMPGQNQPLAPRSPSQKKHKCPYCDTEFTRHHNLKSHLLTHSQEKPYVCQTCQMRFRRLHDLKRHMKLHTGERPHICPKCDRKFARGDALARHSKGQGGCAGRRASMGSFGGEDEFEGSNPGDGDEGAMDGVMYTNGTPHPNDNEMSEVDPRRFSLPSIKAQHVSGSSTGDSYSSHARTPSTYPPAGPRPVQSQGGLYPPNTTRGGGAPSSSTSPSMQNSTSSSHHTPNTSISSMPLSTGGSIFSQSGMTESPKPLSPAAMHSHQLGHDSSINRQRSPSLTTQFQQQHFGRRQSGRSSPPGMSLPSPHGALVPKLPGLANLAPPDQRYTLSSQTPSQQSPGGNQQGQQVTSPSGIYQPQGGALQGRGPLNPQHQNSGSIDSSTNLFASGERGVWSYVQTLEDKVKQLSEQVQVMQNKEKGQEEKINHLSEEVFLLRSQLNTQNNNPQNQSAQGHS